MFGKKTLAIETLVILVLGLVACTPPATTEPTAVPPTETLMSLAETPLPQPQPTPTSSGPLDFPEPTRLDNWQYLPEDEYECTIILQITGGAPPYTVRHDLDELTTWETNPAIVFKARGCIRIVHTITVESADGQTVSHDYAITPPWCG